MDTVNKMENVHIGAIIPKNTVDMKFTERVKADGTIAKFKIRFYAGQEKSLRVSPYIVHGGNMYEALISFNEAGDDYLCGDNDYFEYDLSIPVHYDDDIIIKVSNVDTVYDYTLSCDITLDYYAGTDRVIGGVIA